MEHCFITAIIISVCVFVCVCVSANYMLRPLYGDALHDNPAYKAVAKIVRWISSVIPWVTPKPSRMEWNGFFQFYRKCFCRNIYKWYYFI